MEKCTNTVNVYRVHEDHSDSITEYPCGKWVGGEKRYCDECLEKLQKQYPQGWTGYAGDTCKHGVYVGGCGIDYMCPQCEME